MRYSRVARIILFLLVMAVFCWYQYRWYTNSVMGSDAGSAWYQYQYQTPVAAPAAQQPEAATPAVAAEPEPTPEPEPAGNPLMQLAAENAAAKGLPTPPEVDLDSWELMLANAKHPINEYAPEQLAYLNQTASETDIQYDYNANRCPVDARIAEALLSFAKDCKDAGLPVYLSSGYRSYDEQNYLYWRKVDQVGDTEYAATIVARPGTSEHQTGLACDITDYYRETKDSSLEYTQTYQWLRDHCTDYGFVVRYPADKSGTADSVTGIIYEPWHFRYVGKDVAKYMTENNLCLEEFLALYGVE